MIRDDGMKGKGMKQPERGRSKVEAEKRGSGAVAATNRDTVKFGVLGLLVENDASGKGRKRE